MIILDIDLAALLKVGNFQKGWNVYADFSSKGGSKDLVDKWEDVVPQNELMHKPLYLAALYHLHTKTFPLFYTIQSVQIL